MEEPDAGTSHDWVMYAYICAYVVAASYIEVWPK